MKIHNEMFIPQFDVSQQIEERIDYLEELKSSIEVKMLKMPEGVIPVYKGNPCCMPLSTKDINRTIEYTFLHGK